MGQGGWVVDNCCFCIDLRIGTLIIGYLTLVGNILFSIIAGIAITGGSVVIAQGKNIEQKEAGVFALALGIVMLIVMIVNLAFTISLLVGVHQNKRGHVKAFLIFDMICIILLIIHFLASFAGVVTVASVAQGLVWILLTIYFWVVVRSYWVKMGEMRKNPSSYTA